ncbi:MAG TPA: diacylglycerol kinase family lipid kinase [Phycisphaerae bacterium]|jgi:YegS/Rv2252/BmrU family lipid kinase|nr:diacylglycerol kinase family lipid kinase [Phycisphaerae bacterium]HOJ55169.1 diacylglycerol kinase family lipid kinase [Phycisphaerae bacterium]HOL27371.1 diacylglycerol kinase family lipid kinase [Phycisphaerae bacterium]HPP20689.1 diacylglycerol kinase family lipid kinase [Phycisphaerae bacterium]HPU34146.1 diacylglycerol kinase family lipid kinase [Phycisphaerae bacterium]
MAIRQIHVIINPIAGAFKQASALKHLLSRLRGEGFIVEALTTAAGGDAWRLAAEASVRADAVVAVGGDGTVCEVANGLTGSTVPLIIWPTGTENLVAKSLGFKPDADRVVACLTRGHNRPLDVGVANGRSFLVVAGVGFDAEVVQRLVRTRQGHITHLSYTLPIWRTFWEHRFPAVRVFNEGRLFWEGQGMVFLGNMSRYALGLPVVRDARPDDGLLDLCIFTCRQRRQLIAHSLRTLVKRHIEHPDVRYARVRQVRIESAVPVPVQLDGDPAGLLPLDVSIRAGAIRVQMPPIEAKM